MLGERADEMVEGNFNFSKFKFEEGDFMYFIINLLIWEKDWKMH